MATQTPSVVQNENIHIHRGKGIGGVKADVLRSANARKDRKALADLSTVRKPLFSEASKGPNRWGQTPKNSILTDEEIKKCYEWAKDGIEQSHFTGNDQQKLEKDIQEERVRKEVEKVMSSMRKWTQMAYDLGMPAKEVSEGFGDITKLELEPEVLPPWTSSLSISGNKEADDPFLGAELDLFMPYFDHPFELKLKEEYGDDVTIF